MAAVLLVASGCAGTTSRTEIASTTDVRVEVRGGGELDGWDAHDPRLLRAVAQTRAIVGHPVQFQFRFDTMPRPRGWFFDELFERHVGRVPHQLEWTRSEAADAFDWARGLIRVVLFDYEGSEWRPEIELKEDPGLLRIRMGSGALLPDGAILHAIREAWERELVRRYGGREPDQIPQTELARYGRYLTSHVAERAESAVRAPGDAGPARAKAVILLRVIGTARRLPARHPLLAELRTWLVEVVGTLRDVHYHEAEALARAPADAPIRRAEAAWGAWLRVEAARLSDDALYALVDALVVRPPGDRDLVELGGVDPLPIWLADLWGQVARRWRAEPRRRGSFLYLVALMDRSGGGNVDLLDFREFERLFGAPVSREEFADFLGVGERSLGRVPAVWPALGRGWSRIDAMLPVADALLEGREEPPEELTAALFAVVGLLRQEGGRDELGRLERWIRRRMADHPAEAVSWVTLLAAVSRP